MILEQSEPVLNVHTERTTKRKRKVRGTVAVVIEHEDKRYRLFFFKRHQMLEHSSVLFGYK